MKRKVKHSFGCSCDNPGCANHVLGKICEMIGSDIPIFRPKGFADALGICSPQCLDDFLAKHTISHNMAAVLKGKEQLHDPFALEYRIGDDGHGLELRSPKPAPSLASTEKTVATT